MWVCAYTCLQVQWSLLPRIQLSVTNTSGNTSRDTVSVQQLMVVHLHSMVSWLKYCLTLP